MTVTTICAKYKHVDGWHTFVSDELPGLYVAHKDAKVAFEDVGPSIALLMRLDHGVECEVIPELPLNDFLRAHGGSVSDDLAMLTQSRRFALTATV